MLNRWTYNSYSAVYEKGWVILPGWGSPWYPIITVSIWIKVGGKKSGPWLSLAWQLPWWGSKGPDLRYRYDLDQALGLFMVQRLIISDVGHPKEFKTTFVWWLTIISKRTFSNIKVLRQSNNFPWALNELSFESWLLAHWMGYTFPRRKSGLQEKCSPSVLRSLENTHNPFYLLPLLLYSSVFPEGPGLLLLLLYLQGRTHFWFAGESDLHGSDASGLSLFHCCSGHFCSLCLYTRLVC